MYARLLGEIYTAGTEDINGILFVQFPIAELAAALGRSAQTCKRTLRELEDAGLILRVRREIGAPNRIYVLIPRSYTVEKQKNKPPKTVLQKILGLL